MNSASCGGDEYFPLFDHDYKLPLGVDSSGHIVYAPPYRPVIVPLGAPRSGKTRQVACPMAAAWPGPAVIVSVRTDLIQLTMASRARRGPVMVFDPAGLTGPDIDTESWNLLQVCQDWKGAVDFAFNLTMAVEAQSPLRDGAFWYTLARKLIAPMLFAAATSGCSVADVVRWIQRQEEFEVRSLLAAAPEGGEEASGMIEAVWQIEDRARSSAFATADVVMNGFNNPTVMTAVTGGTDFDEFLAQEGATLYVVAPATRQDQYSPIITGALGHVINGALERHHSTNSPARLLILIDEAGNVGHIPELAQLSSIAAGCGIQLVTLWHNPGQLAATYGNRAETVISNSHVMLVLPGTDAAAARLIDERIGPDPHPSLPPGTGLTRLRRIPPGSAICIAGNQDPFLLRLLSPDFDPDLRFELGR